MNEQQAELIKQLKKVNETLNWTGSITGVEAKGLASSLPHRNYFHLKSIRNALVWWSWCWIILIIINVVAFIVTHK